MTKKQTKKIPKKSKLKKSKLPIVLSREKGSNDNCEYKNFPISHYSYSSLIKFGTDPFMFKINYINGDYIESTMGVSGVIGKALHKAIETYLGGNKDVPVPNNEGEAIKIAYLTGAKYLENYSDGFIEYNKKIIPDRQKLNERFSFAFYGYIREFNYHKFVKELLLVEDELKYKVSVDGKNLPVPLKGFIDLAYLDYKDRVIITDHKFVSKYSDSDKIDGAKLIQAVQYYFLVYAKTGKKPHSIIFNEYKYVENQDGSPQLRRFEIVFEDHPYIFDFYYRYYYDVTRALLGEQVYIPNVYAMYDKEVSVLAYIHRLDEDKAREEAFKKEKVNNITDFLKKRIQKDGAMKKYLETVSIKFVSAETLNYKEMKIEERIKMKLAEHGLAVEFDSKVVGNNVELYRYEPSVGLKMTKIESFVKDIEQVVEKSGIRVLAPIPNSGLIGFEVPLDVRTFPKAPESKGFELAIGNTVMGETRYFDIRKAPHTLVAGSSGSGKSVFLNEMINQLLKIDNVILSLFDPKQVELSHFENHKKVSIYSSEEIKIASALKRIVEEMEHRYKKMKEKGVRDISELKGLDYMFVIIDEFADLMLSTEKIQIGEKTTVKIYKSGPVEASNPVYGKAGEIIEGYIKKISQKGRACGIHLIIATQRPSVKVIPGDIKVNFPTKVVFRMDKEASSRVMIDDSGAEKLLGMGDMLFATESGIERLQGFKS